MAEQTINATLAQDGVRIASAWVDDATPVGVEESLGQVMGLRFTGLPTANPDRSEFLSVSATAVFSLTNVGAGQVPATVSLYARRQRDPQAYATANLPPALTALTPLSDVLIAPEATVTAAGTQLLTFALDTAALDAARGSGGVLFDFTGFAFHLHVRTADGTALVVGSADAGTAATHAYTLDTRVFTGIEIEWGRLAASRPDICPVCASESLREEWVWCEFHERMECSMCTDPDTDELSDIIDSGDELIGEEG